MGEAMKQRGSSNVLVIDDSAAARATIASILQDEGFHVIELESGLGAGSAILKKSIDIVVVDLSMPALTGDALIGLIRSNPRLNHVLVFVVSAESESALRKLAQSHDVDGVLAKRDVREHLVSMISRSLLRRSGRLGTGA